MTDIPIIFSGPMVRAWLAGSKSMTRRLLYTKRKAKAGTIPASATEIEGYRSRLGRLSPEGFPTDLAVDEYWTLSGWQKVKSGDRLWVRETHWRFGHWALGTDRKWRFVPSGEGGISFDHQFSPAPHRVHGLIGWWKRPGIFLPRILSRLTLIVGAVKIERLRRISNADAKAEGTFVDGYSNEWHEVDPRRYVLGFEQTWERLHGPSAWSLNPWVVAITASKVIKANIDAAEARAA